MAARRWSDRSIRHRGGAGAGCFAWPCVPLVSLLALSIGPPWLAFAAAFAVLASFSLLVPPLVFRFSSRAGKVFRSLRRYRGKAVVEAELAAANLSRALLRNSVTIATLAAAVAMTVGVSVMVFSFRETVQVWINDILTADLFVGPASNEIVGSSSSMPSEALRFPRNSPRSGNDRHVS